MPTTTKTSHSVPAQKSWKRTVLSERPTNGTRQDTITMNSTSMPMYISAMAAFLLHRRNQTLDLTTF